MKNVLIVYYSMSGHTKTLAERIARETGWTLARIEDATKQMGMLQQLRAVMSTFFGLKPNIRYSGPSPAAFDLIVLGGPVWVGKMAAPLRTFVANHRHEFKALALFCTYGGSGADKAMKGLAARCTTPPSTTLAVTEAQLKSNDFGNAINTFVADLHRVRNDVVNKQNTNHHHRRTKQNST
ncbi:MAG: flavodoxin family protein [Casimicrobium sp.]